MLSSAEVPVNL